MNRVDHRYKLDAVILTVPRYLTKKNPVLSDSPGCTEGGLRKELTNMKYKHVFQELSYVRANILALAHEGHPESVNASMDEGGHIEARDDK